MIKINFWTLLSHDVRSFCRFIPSFFWSWLDIDVGMFVFSSHRCHPTTEQQIECTQKKWKSIWVYSFTDCRVSTQWQCAMLFGSICRANNRKEGKLNFPLFHCDSFPVVLHRVRVGTALHQLSTTSKSANGKWKQFSGYLIAPTPNSHSVMQLSVVVFGGISIICVQFAHRHITDSNWS